MKTLFRILLFLVAGLFISQPAQSQRFLKKLSDKAKEKVENRMEQKVEEKADEKIDEEIDKLFDSLEGEADKDAEEASGSTSDAARQARMQRIMKGFGMSGEPVPVAENYRFNNLIQMHVESYDKNGKKISEGEFITHLDPDSKSMAYQMLSGDMAQEGQGMFIIDAQNDAMIILNDENNEKTGIVYGMGTFFQTLGESYEEEVELSETPESYLANPNVKKTGRSKTISGYKCDEYVYSDEESESNIWITTDMKLNTRDFFSTLFKTSLYSHGMPWGYMMAVSTTDKDTGEKSVMEVTKVDEKSNVNFALGEYQMTNLGSFQMPAGEEEIGETEKN